MTITIALIEKQHIIIADGDTHMQNSLVTILCKDAGLPVHTPDTLPELLQLISLRPPDVLIIDVATFCFSFFSDSSLISIAADAGARGFVSKDARCEEVTKAI